MRKYFLFTVCALSFLGATNVQANDALFPDLAKIQAQKQEKEAVSKEPVKLFESELSFNEPVAAEDDGFVEVETEKQPQKTQESNQKKTDAEEEKAKSGYFEIYPHDVEIVTPPVDESSQFCKGSLTLENQTKYDLKALQLIIQYGEAKIPYTFRPIASGTSGTGNVFLMGKSCQYLAKTASIEVKSCKADKISNAECKQLVRYILR